MKLKLLIGMGCMALFAACASTPQPNAALETARTAVQAAEADPNVSKYAALDLQAARKQLDLAEAAAMHNNANEVAQPAYMATQTARLAQARAAAKADDARVAAGQVERDRIQLAARTREVDSSKLAADNAKLAADNAKLEAQNANAQNASLQAEIDKLKAKPTDRGLVLTLGDVLFDTGKAELNAGAARTLDQLSAFLTEHPDRRVQIDGFTDSIGSASFNDDLSERRANSVKSALMMRGIDGSRIGTQGYGKEFPVASNAESGGRQLNRRVEVVIGGDNGSPISSRGTALLR